MRKELKLNKYYLLRPNGAKVEIGSESDNLYVVMGEIAQNYGDLCVSEKDILTSEEKIANWNFENGEWQDSENPKPINPNDLMPLYFVTSQSNANALITDLGTLIKSVSENPTAGWSVVKL